MNASLLRLDDACETMDHERWVRLEAILDRRGVRPIVAVIPENRDPRLAVATPDPGFWKTVRRWEAKGWTIAMHGCHHTAETTEGGLVPFHRKSEFAGLSARRQAERIERGWSVFEKQGVRPTVWVAPWHSFDVATLRALEARTPLRILSDGLALLPFRRSGFLWLPQQEWFPRIHARGVWTACLHPNGMGERDLERLDGFLDGNGPRFSTGIDDLARRYSGRPSSIEDRLFEAAFHAFGRVRRISGLRAAPAAFRRLREAGRRSAPARPHP